jgi:hypothetical protein
MKVSTETKTFWEVCASKSENCRSEMGRPREYGGDGEDFRDKTEAEEYAREVGYRWVKEIAYAYDDQGIYGESTPRSKRFYRVQPSVVMAHARCCHCGQAETFQNGVLAYDWKFEHEVMHNFRCVEAWESDFAYPGKMFPLRKRVPMARLRLGADPRRARTRTFRGGYVRRRGRGLARLT